MKFPAYRAEDETIILRCWDPADAVKLKIAIEANIEYLKPWMPWVKFEPTPLEQKVNLLREFRSNFDGSKDFTYGIFTKDESEVIGGCGLHKRLGEHAFEIGYWISKKYAGRGYATKVAAILIRLGFNVDGIDRIEIHHIKENLNSRRIPEKLGFKHEGVRERFDFSFDGEVRDTEIWSLFRSMYKVSAEAQGITAYGAMNEALSLEI